MPRKPVNLLMTAVALGCIVVGSTIAWSNIANAPSGQGNLIQANLSAVDFDRTFAYAGAPSRSTPPMTKADFDQAFANAIATSRNNDMLATMSAVYFGQSLGAAPRRATTPDIMTKVYFDQTFATAITPRPDNTPSNREKLRDTAWKRILGSL